MVVSEQRQHPHALRADVTLKEVRDAFARLGRATRADVADELGCSRDAVRRVVQRMFDRGEICDTGETQAARGGRQGRPAPLLELRRQEPARAAAVTLASGSRLELDVPVRRLRKPVRGVTMDEITPAPPARPRPRKAATGKKVRRRKGRLGVDDMLKLADELGYTASRTKKGHFKFSKPGRTPIFAPSSPSDYRSVKNVLADLRRAA